MGTGGCGSGGKKGGSGGKKPPEDKIEIEGYPSENEEDDSSSETSFELKVDPQQLASVGLDRPLLRLRLTPRRRLTTAAPGLSHPHKGGTCHHHWEEELKLCHYQKRQNGTGYNQPIMGGGGPPQPPDGEGGGIGPPLSERSRRTPQQTGGWRRSSSTWW